MARDFIFYYPINHVTQFMTQTFVDLYFIIRFIFIKNQVVMMIGIDEPEFKYILIRFNHIQEYSEKFKFGITAFFKDQSIS